MAPFAVSSGRAFLADQRGRLLVVDVTNIDAPVLLVKRDLPLLATDVRIRGHCLLMAGMSPTGQAEVLIEDDSDPANARTLVSDTDLPGAWGVAMDGDKVLVAADWMGLYVLRWADAGTCDT